MVKFLRAPSFRFVKTATEKRIHLTVSVKRIIPVSDYQVLEIWNKRKKRMRTCIQTPCLYFCKNCFYIVPLFLLSVQWRVNPFDFPILSLYLIFCVKSNVFFSSMMPGEICVMYENVWVKFVSYEINSFVME